MKSLSKDLDEGIETGYTFEKAQKLIDYCKEKNEVFKEKQDFELHPKS